MKAILELLSSVEGHAKRQWLKYATMLATLVTGWLAAKGFDSLALPITTAIIAIATGLFEVAASKLANERRKYGIEPGEVYQTGSDGSQEYWGNILNGPPLRPIPGELPSPPIDPSFSASANATKEIIIPRGFPTPKEIAESEAKLSPPKTVVMWTDDKGPQEKEFDSAFEAAKFRNETPGAKIKTPKS